MTAMTPPAEADVIALDAMGGDHAPAATVEGAVLAARELGLEIALVGREDDIRRELARHRTAGLKLHIVHASEVVGMAEHPAQAVRQKKDSSIRRAMELVKRGEAAGVFSAGNSGAVMAAALFILGRIEGVHRPALATVFPVRNGRTLVADIGANTECDPHNLVQFAFMGAAYMERVLGVPRPRVGLLSNGEEETKGNALVQATYPLLRQTALNFIGNVEGKDLPMGVADVVVCDGFTGNVVLKLAEGIAEFLLSTLKSELTRDPISLLGAALATPAFRRVRRLLDYAEVGGAPLLGVDGVVLIGHGRSTARAIRNGLRVTQQAINGRLVATIREGLAALMGTPVGRQVQQDGAHDYETTGDHLDRHSRP
jgi:glycerol-3-phosphate acyltransferase PlsX